MDAAYFSLKNNGEATSIVLNPNIKQEVNTFHHAYMHKLLMQVETNNESRQTRRTNQNN